MSNPVSMATMITQVQTRAGLINFSGNITTAMIRDILNEEIAEMFDEQIAQRNMEYFRSSVSFQTVPNQSGYFLPTDFFEMISMDVIVSPFQTLTAVPYMEHERNRFRWYNGWVAWLPVWFRLLGTASQSGAVLTPERSTSRRRLRWHRHLRSIISRAFSRSRWMARRMTT